MNIKEWFKPGTNKEQNKQIGDDAIDALDQKNKGVAAVLNEETQAELEERFGKTDDDDLVNDYALKMILEGHDSFLKTQHLESEVASSIERYYVQLMREYDAYVAQQKLLHQLQRELINTSQLRKRREALSGPQEKMAFSSQDEFYQPPAEVSESAGRELLAKEQQLQQRIPEERAKLDKMREVTDKSIERYEALTRQSDKNITRFEAEN